MYIPVIQNILHGTIGITVDVIPLGPMEWIVALIAGFLPILALELAKLYARRHKVYF